MENNNLFINNENDNIFNIEENNSNNNTTNNNNKPNIFLYIIITTIIIITSIIIGIVIAKNVLNTTEDNNDKKTNYIIARDKVIDVLILRTYKDYNNDKSMYYKADSFSEDNIGCAGSRIVDFYKMNFEVYFVCYQNEKLAYERKETYYWKENKITTAEKTYADMITQQPIYSEVNATIDNNGNFTCNINNCTDYKTSMETVKNEFLTILSQSNVNINELIY